MYEVGPRDGLQNELRTLPTRDKARLIKALVAAGEKRIEVTSFVSAQVDPPARGRRGAAATRWAAAGA